VHAICGMGGVDFAFEVVGTQKTIEQALASTHRGGTCVVVGVSPAGTRLSIDPGMLLQQRVLTGTSFGGGHQRTDVPLLLDLFMDGKYQLKELVTRRLPLSELNHAFDLMKKVDADLLGEGEHHRHEHDGRPSSNMRVGNIGPLRRRTPSSWAPAP